MRTNVGIGIQKLEFLQFSNLIAKIDLQVEKWKIESVRSNFPISKM